MLLRLTSKDEESKVSNKMASGSQKGMSQTPVAGRSSLNQKKLAELPQGRKAI